MHTTGIIHHFSHSDMYTNTNYSIQLHMANSPCYKFPLLIPFSTYLAPSSCDRNRPPRSQVACKLNPLVPHCSLVPSLPNSQPFLGFPELNVRLISATSQTPSPVYDTWTIFKRLSFFLTDWSLILAEFTSSWNHRGWMTHCFFHTNYLGVMTDDLWVFSVSFTQLWVIHCFSHPCPVNNPLVLSLLTWEWVTFLPPLPVSHSLFLPSWPLDEPLLLSPVTCEKFTVSLFLSRMNCDWFTVSFANDLWVIHFFFHLCPVDDPLFLNCDVLLYT